MAPVAALIVVRPCIEVNAVESDSLNADAQSGDVRAHFPVEAVLVHAEIGGGVAHADEAGHVGSVRNDKGASHIRASCSRDLRRSLSLTI